MQSARLHDRAQLAVLRRRRRTPSSASSRQSGPKAKQCCASGFSKQSGIGEMPAGLDPAAFARYLMTVMEGMSVRAASGASRKELREIATLTMSMWPA